MDSQKNRFKALYEQNREDLYKYLKRSGFSDDTAMDLLQDVFFNFFRIFKTRPLPDDTGSRMYLFRTARNVTINYLKSAYSSRVDIFSNLADSFSDGSRLPSSINLEEDLLNRLELEENRGKLGEMLNKLKENEKTALILRYDLDMNQENIAKIMDVSVSSVSRLLKRAHKRLILFSQEKSDKKPKKIE